MFIEKIKSYLQSYFEKQDIFRNIDQLSEDLDLKNITVKIVPAHNIYPEFIIAIAKLLLVVLATAVVTTLISALTQSSRYFSPNAIFTIVSYTVPYIISSCVIWRYFLFKHGIAPHLKSGTQICKVAATFLRYVVIFWVATNIIVSPFSIGAGVGATVFVSVITIFVLRLELERMGLMPMFKAISNLLGKK